MTTTEISAISTLIRENIEKVIIGKGDEINLVLTALLAGGHVLLEDVPGTGKTELAKALAKSFSCKFSRTQFTPDLLPSDLTGIHVYSPKTGEFTFRSGSLFANIILADEINRATPRTQSGLLESMEEKQITVDGETFALELPYFVIATQNPIETQGTFPLPEAQLDRFLLKFSLGYPQRQQSVDMLKRFIHVSPASGIVSVCTAQQLIEMQSAVKDIFIHDDLLAFIIDLTQATRSNDHITLGVSARGSLGLMRAAQSYAAINGRDFVSPDDIIHLCPYVFSHRIIMRGSSKNKSADLAELLSNIISKIPVPSENFKSK